MILCGFGLYEVEDYVEDDDVDDEEEDYHCGIEDGVAVYQLVEDFVGGAVAADEEHIVIVEKVVRCQSGNHEEAEDAKGDAHVFPLHTSHTCDDDIEACEKGDAVSNCGNEVRPGEDGVRVIVLRRAVGAENSAKGAKDKYEVQCSFLYSATSKCGEGDGYKLDAAKEEGQANLPIRRIIYTADDNFRNFK